MRQYYDSSGGIRTFRFPLVLRGGRVISHSKQKLRKNGGKNMNNRNKMRGMSLLLTLSSIVMIASSVQAEDNGSTEIAYKNLGAGIALGQLNWY